MFKVGATGINETNHKDVWGSGCIDPRILDLGTIYWYIEYAFKVILILSNFYL
jgi:hypothetical protein